MSEYKANNEAPPALKIIAIVAIVWNSLGLLEVYMRLSMASGVSRRSTEEQLFYQDFPVWANSTLAIVALAGMAGAFFLLIKKAWAFPMFIISLIGILVLDFYVYFGTDFLEFMGTSSVFYDLLTIAIATFLVIYSNKAKRHGWIS